VERVTASRASRAGRTAFAAAAAVALYTATAYAVLVHVGLGAVESALAAAAVGVLIAAFAGRLVRKGEARTSEQRIRSVVAAASPHAPSLAHPAPAAHPAPPAPPESPREAGFAVNQPREERESREIQAALLPRIVPAVDGYHVEVAYHPCGALGGDFYDFVGAGDGCLLVTVGDVSGKGPAGAIVMAMVQTLFRENAPRSSGPADLLRRVNAGFAGALGKGVFVTALVALLDPRRHRFTLAGAGHHPVLLLNPGERRSTQVSARGLALGLVTGRAFDESLVETTVDLAPGESLLLYTDGATESGDVAKGMGENRFLAAAAASVLGGPVGALARLGDDLWQGGGRRDDTTLVLVSRLGGRNPLSVDRNLSGAKA
jgi:serine phosphatase RsbU (regulator of sigma subunit)